MNFKIVNYCEIDKAASRSYSMVHNIPESLNLGDITKVKDIPEFDMLVGGSPCQSFSCSGKREGSMWECKKCGHKYNPLTVHYSERDKCPECGSMDITGTTSSLIIEYLRFIREGKPKIAVYENVKNLVSKEFNYTYELFKKELEEYGYNVYQEVLNSKYYGIPQNRERIILVIIRKDVDNKKFEFPEKNKDIPSLKSFLQEDVDEKYYFKQEKSDKLFDGMKDNVKKKMLELDYPVCVASRGRNPENPNSRVSGLPTVQRLEINYLGTTNTLTTVQKDNYIIECKKKEGVFKPENFRLRKLTPMETWLLMGFSEEDYEKARYYTDEEADLIKKNQKKYIEENGKIVCEGDTNLYRQAGNSIVVNVLEAVYKSLYEAMPELFDDLKVLSLFSGIGAFEKALLNLQKSLTWELVSAII
jgi:DNA (cytosine-5)-methyltransferase 1